jgi:hypothetical protein
MSYADAKAQADRALWDQAVNTALTSFISGGVMSGAQSGGQYVAQRIQERNATQNATGGENATVSETETVGAENATTEKPQAITDEQIREAMNELYPREKTGQERMAELEAEMDRMINGGELATEDGQNRYQALAQEWNDLRNQEDAEVAGRADSLATEEAPPEQAMPEYTGRNERLSGNPLAGRTTENVGSRSVKAYQYENPEVKPYFQDAARGILSDINNSMPGQRIFNEDLHYQTGGEKGWSGNKRITTDDLADIKDTYGYTWDELREAAEDIIHDRGRENNAASKRMEFLIHDRLANGYTDVEGRPIPASQEYLDFLEERQINEYRREGVDDLMANAERYAPPEGAPEGFEAMGAASRGFSGMEAYNELLTDENVQPVRPWAVREMEVPKTDKDGRRVTEFAANAAGAAATSDAVADTLAQLIGEGAMSFDSRSKQQSINNAVSELEKRPISEVVGEISERVSEGTIKDGDIEKALVAYNLLSNDGTADGQARAAAMLPMLGKMANISGRNLNMFGILKKLDPNMQVQAVQDDINRTIKEMNKSRSPRKPVGKETGEQISKVSKQAKEGAAEKAGKASGKIRVTRGKVKVEGNQVGEPFLFEYAQKVGEALAKSLIPKEQKQKTTMQRITAQLRRFAGEKMEGRKSESITATELLRDYVQNQEFYTQAWEQAQQEIRNHAEQRMQEYGSLDEFLQSDAVAELAALEDFVNSGIGFGLDSKNKIFAKALASAAIEAGESKRVLQTQEAIGVRNAAENIANVLILQTGADGEMAQTIREAAVEYAKNITQDDTNTDKRLESTIREAMKDIGEKLSDVAKSSRRTKNSVKDKIVDLLVRKYGFSAADATGVSDVVGERFAEMAEAQAKKILESRFAKRNPAAQRSAMEMFEEYANLGAFDIGSNFNEAAARKLFGDQAVKINEELAEMFKEAKTEEEKAQVLDDIYKDIASRIKPTIGEIFDDWRNLAMLGNLKTHERNFFGSAAFRPFASLKRTIGAGLERLYVDQENRTKAIIGWGKDSRALLKWAKQDAKTAGAKNRMSYSGTTGDNARSAIDEHRKYLGPLDGLRRWNMAIMEGTDMVWKRREYALSLAGFLKARGYTQENAPAGVLEDARTYAAQEAMKATFNDRNKFSDTIVKLRAKGNKPWSRALNVISKGALPYARTPANVAVRMVEYSPAGLAEGFRQLAVDVKSGEATVSDGLDKIASGLTGTGAMVLGAALAYGLIPGVKLIGRLDEEDRKEDPNAIEYSLKIGDKYYGISWLAPANVPLFIGANLYNSINRNWNSDMDGWDVVSAIAETGTDMLDPMLELSMLSSLNDIFEATEYEEGAGDKLLAVLSTAATNYFTQGLPTIFGQLEQSTEKTKSSVYSNADNPMQRSFERTVGKATQRIPGIDLYQVERLDAEGKPVENGPWYQRAFDAVINPFTHGESGTTPVTKELARLKVTAPAVSKTVSYTDSQGNKHDNYRLNADEFSNMQRLQLGNSNRIMGEMLESSDYEKLPDKLKEKALEYAKDYARELARGEVLPGYDGKSSWMEGIEGKEAAAIIGKVTTGELSDAMTALATGWREGYADDSGALEGLESAAKTYEALTPEMQKAVKEGLSGRVAAYLEAREKGVGTKTFANLYRKYWDIGESEKTAGEKANEWAYELERAQERRIITEAQKNVLKQALTISSGFTVETGKFDQLTESGLSADAAQDLGWLIQGLEVQEGYKEVRDIQKAEAIGNMSGLSEADRIAALKIYGTDAQDENLDQMLEMGYTSKDYLNAWKLISDEREKGGTGTKRRTINALAQMYGVSTAKATEIYEVWYPKGK